MVGIFAEVPAICLAPYALETLRSNESQQIQPRSHTARQPGTGPV